MSQLTKKAITESFLKLINQMPFDKITVKDIVEDCGVNRNTFYYHYRDIYDLLEEVLQNEAARVLSRDLSSETWPEVFLDSCSFALQNRKGIYHIYNSVNRRQVDEYLYKITGKIMVDFVKKKAEGMKVEEEDVLMIADFYKCAMTGILLQWLDDGMRQEPEDRIRRLGALLDGNIREMLKKAERLPR